MNYNAANQLSAHTDTALAVPAPVSMTAVYDGASRRVKQVAGGVTRYSVYDASGTLIEIDEVGGAKADYIRASGMTLARIAGSTVTWLHHDHLGSAVAGTNSTGAVVWRESEQPFGEDWTTAAANDNQAGYTGHVEDAATGLTYMQARYYNPVIGRFLSIDPVGFSPTRPGMFNRYAYAANDPVNQTDASGMESYFIVRPIIKVGFRVGYHSFVVVTKEGSGRSGQVVARYSYGPLDDKLVNLTDTPTETDREDKIYLEEFQNGEFDNITWVEIRASNDETMAAGENVVGHENYELVPSNDRVRIQNVKGELFFNNVQKEEGSANSNSAATAVATDAEAANGQTFQPPKPPKPSFGGLSGADQAGNVVRRNCTGRSDESCE